MFERFDEPARRTLFCALLALREHGGTHIQPDHVVLGIIRSDRWVIRRFTLTDEALETLRTRLETGISGRPKYPEEHGRFSGATINALERAVIEAEDLQDREIRPEHLLLGVLIKTSGAAADALHAAGVHAAAIRQFLQSPPPG